MLGTSAIHPVVVAAVSSVIAPSVGLLISSAVIGLITPSRCWLEAAMTSTLHSTLLQWLCPPLLLQTIGPSINAIITLFSSPLSVILSCSNSGQGVFRMLHWGRVSHNLILICCSIL
nr:hypothetical protein Itr_chr15CG13360 [Ipomoea trifida]